MLLFHSTLSWQRSRHVTWFSCDSTQGVPSYWGAFVIPERHPISGKLTRTSWWAGFSFHWTLKYSFILHWNLILPRDWSPEEDVLVCFSSFFFSVCVGDCFQQFHCCVNAREASTLRPFKGAVTNWKTILWSAQFVEFYLRATVRLVLCGNVLEVSLTFCNA